MARDAIAELAEFVGLFEEWSLDLKLDPDDPASVDAAIRAMEAEIDAKASPYDTNPAVMDMAERMKGEYREAIRAQRHDDAEGEPEPEETP